MAKPVLTPVPEVVEVHVPQLPPGVQMHQGGTNPYGTVKTAHVVADPKKPPPGWMGAYVTCGQCGDFMGSADKCPNCAPHDSPSNIQMSTLPKMMAR